MQGLVTLAQQFGQFLSALLPTFCYIAAICLFMTAGWGFWTLAQPGNSLRHRPWVPWVALVLCGVFASFDKILSKANVSAGTGVTVAFGGALSYTPASTSNLLGSGPGATVVNVVILFQQVFQSFGAMFCFIAVLTYWMIVCGRSQRGYFGCGVQFVFGVALVNILTITKGLIAYFPGTSAT